MASAQPAVQPQPEPSLRRVLDTLKSYDACHGKLTELKEAGGLDNMETVRISQALTGFETGRSGLLCLLKRRASEELKTKGGNLEMRLTGSLQSATDWEMVEAVVDVLDPQQQHQQQNDSAGKTSAAAVSAGMTSAAAVSAGTTSTAAVSAGTTSAAAVSAGTTSAAAAENPRPLKRWFLDRAVVLLGILTVMLDIWVEDFVFSGIARLKPGLVNFYKERNFSRNGVFAWTPNRGPG